jgi:phosphoglycerate dehydrogenase-like enzyme
MRVAYYDPFVKADSNTPFAKIERLEDLVKTADIVTVHASSNEHNRHMFNDDIFSKFKQGSYFVNTARGELVDSEALINALESGRLKGAALDVVDHEYDVDFSQKVLDHPLIRYAKTCPRLIITPHIAGSTQDAWHLTQRFVIEKTIEFMDEVEKGQTS